MMKMTDDENKNEGRTSHLAKKDARRDRLKDALRENLKRRKSQARARGDFTNASSASDDIAQHRSEENPGK